MLKNIIANFLGRFWSILSNYLFIPLYISILGIQSYSVISFSLILVGIMSLLDVGMTATLSREFANKSSDTPYKLRTLSTFEIIYWGISLCIIVIFYFSAPIISTQFIKVSTIPLVDVIFSIQILGVGIAFQMLSNFYMGGLIGLEYQVSANVFQILWGVFKNGLVVLVIWLSPSIVYFFIWQIIVTVIYAFSLRYYLIKKFLSQANDIKFEYVWDKKILRNTGKFATGMMLISVVAVINTQLDKIAISKLLPLEELGYYTLAIGLTQGLIVLTNPVSTASLPRFTALYSENKISEASNLFNKMFNLVATIVCSLSVILIFYCKDIIYLWTGNMELASKSYYYTPYLSVGSALLAILVLPFNIAIANGYTRFNNYLGIASLLFTIPAYWISVSIYGSEGAAISWMILQIGITPIYLYLINKKFLVGISIIGLITKNILLPFATATIFTMCFYYLIPLTNNRLIDLVIIMLIALFAVGVNLVVSLSKENKNNIISFVRTKFFLLTNTNR
jgi:O-antigen/teichoic acid export membrane protein